MSQDYACPSCGGVVRFQASIAVFAVCPFCRSMVVRHDVNVEAIGQMAQLPPDLSPLQIGTNGEFAGEGFTLIGRVRKVYADGSWNEWCALFGDGRYGWLAEAQGIYMVSFELAPPENFASSPDAMALSSRWVIEGQTYTVTDSKENFVLASQGELPFAATPDRKATSIDLTGPDGRFASVEFGDSGTRIFTGAYVHFKDLNLSNLRSVPGWSSEAIEPERNETTALRCPNCGAAVVLRAAGFSMSATCGACGSLIDTATPDLALIRRAQERQGLTPALPIGRRGTLFGIPYEVIGLQRVRDEFSGWLEYLLFNPWEGFAWLVTYNGHWSFVRRLFAEPELHEGSGGMSGAQVVFEGQSYRIFAASNVTTDYVLGEFYWKVAIGMRTQVTDFVCPPRILSREMYPGLQEQTWSQGEYVPSELIATAFNLEQPLREPEGTYLNQPNPYAERGRQLKALVPLILLVLLGVQIVSARNAAHQRVFNASYNYQAGPSNAPIVTPPFDIAGGNQALEYDLAASVDNNWLELDLQLINATTHQVADSREQGIEFYHGYDEGYWSEGKPNAAVMAPGVAPGKYYLTIDASADPRVTAMPFSVAVVRDVVVWSNFWIALAVVLVYPLYCWGRAYAFERARWLESDYRPALYGKGTEEDS